MELEARRLEARRRRERLERFKALVVSHRVHDRDRARKFFFVTRTGHVPYLEIGLETARRLEAGNLVIVDLPWQKLETFALLPREVGAELAAFDGECVRFRVG